MADEPEPKPIRMTPAALRECLDLQAKGFTNGEIADKVGLSRQSVGKHLARVNEKAFAKIEGRRSAVLAKQLKILDWVVSEAANGWATTKQPAMLRELREAMADTRHILRTDDRPKDVISDDYVIDLGEDRSDDDSIVFPDDGTDGPVTYTVGEARRTDGAPIRANIDRPMTLAQARAAGVHIPGVTDPPPPAIEGKKSDPEQAAYLEREAERDRERRMNPDELALSRWADRRLG